MSRTRATAEKAAAWIAEHRTGKCAETVCRRIVQNELDLGFDKNPFKRQEQFESRKAKWQPLRDALDNHKWYFQREACQECGQNALCLTGQNMTACLKTCLTTAIPWFPTGQQIPWIHSLIAHLKKCTSHSSSLTPKDLGVLAKAHTSSKTLQEKMWSSNSTSSKGQTQKRTPKKPLASSFETRSPASGLSRPKLQPFSIPKKSN